MAEQPLQVEPVIARCLQLQKFAKYLSATATNLSNQIEKTFPSINALLGTNPTHQQVHALMQQVESAVIDVTREYVALENTIGQLP